MLWVSVPITKREIIDFLQTNRYYSQFIEQYAMIVKPLTRLLKYDATSPQATP